MIEILGLNVYEENNQNKLIVDIEDNGSEDSEIIENKENHNLYLNQIEKEKNVGNEIEIEEDKTNEYDRNYKKKEKDEEAFNML